MGMSIGEGKAKVRPDMNVTPLVDVVLVLLIIFMVLAPVMTEAFNVRLPPKDETDAVLDQVNDPHKALVLALDAEGNVDINGVQVEHDELPERLARMFNARPDNVLYVDAHDLVQYGRVVEAVDGARHAGASPVVMITKKLDE